MVKKTISWLGRLVDNPLTEDPNDFVFKVKTQQTLTNADIAKRLIGEGTELKFETIIDVLDRSDRIVRELLLSGQSVGTGVYNAYPIISGVWNGITDSFDDKRHKANVSFQPTALLRSGFNSVSTEILGISANGPEISTITDTWSTSVNSVLTPGEMAVVKGRNLSVAGTNESVGIFFVNASDESRTQVDMRRVSKNMPSELLFKVPELMPGDYWFEIVTQGNKNKELKEPRVSRFDRPLSVLKQ